MPKLYLDTNIFIYATEDSKNLFGKDISASSSRLIYEAVLCKHHLIVSNWTIEEIARIRDIKNFQAIEKLIEKKRIYIQYTGEDMEQAKSENPQHFHDQLHGILAIRAGADYLVTRNKQDFKQFSDRIKIVKPEELI